MSTTGIQPRYLSRKEAEVYTGYSRWSLWRAVKAGELRTCGGEGRSLRFDRLELDRWMQGEDAPVRGVASRAAGTSGDRGDSKGED